MICVKDCFKLVNEKHLSRLKIKPFSFTKYVARMPKWSFFIDHFRKILKDFLESFHILVKHSTWCLLTDDNKIPGVFKKFFRVKN